VANKIRAVCAAAIVPLALIAGCGSSSSTPSAAGTPATTLPSAPAKAGAQLSETGSTLLFPLISSWANEYKKLYPQVTISTAGTGSGTGIADATAGTADIGASDAYLSATDLASGPSLENIALAISAQQINYNLPGVTSLKLDGTVLAGIYSGQITQWNSPAITALNPGVSLPAMTIVPLRRADGSGDTFLFTSYLSAQDPSGWPSSQVGTTITWPRVAGETAETGNGGMVTGCGSIKGCIAYIGVSYLSKSQAAGLGDAQLKNAAGKFVPIDAATISAAAAAQTSSTPASETKSLINGPGANAYPIINYEYAIVSTSQPDATKAEDIRAFLYWAVHSGQNSAGYLNAVDFQALPASVVTLSDAQIAKIGS
jgi:phosphate transport system substrate-binding protein